MGNISLVDELLGLQAQAAGHVTADFAASIAASNGMLIPPELLAQARLPANADLEHAKLLKREYRHKSRLLDADRHIVACVCDIVATKMTEPAPALAACVAALASEKIPRVIAFAFTPASDTLPAVLEHIEAAEVIMRVTLDTAAQSIAPNLRALRTRLRALPDTRLLAVLYDSGAAPFSSSNTRTLLRELAEHVDLLCALPLLTQDSRSHYIEIATQLDEMRLTRVAPGLYAHRHLSVPPRPLPWLNRIMTRLPQADVLGLGLAARSRFNEIHFDSHADPCVYARDMARGGYGIAHTYASTPIEQFIEALLIKLASGAVVDVTALAERCQCASPPFLQACAKTFDRLRASSAVSGKDARHVFLKAANDAWFAEVHAQLGQLRDALPAITPLAKR